MRAKRTKNGRFEERAAPPVSSGGRSGTELNIERYKKMIELGRMTDAGLKVMPKKMDIDTTNMCSHLQAKLFAKDGVYHHLWLAMQNDSELTAVVRARQLHIYRNGKKILVLAGKAAPKVIREDILTELL